MRAPLPPGAPVDLTRMRRWLADFANYRHTVTQRRIELWLGQFDLPDIDLGARILDCVDFVTNEKISASYRSALNALPGWHRLASKRTGQWRFAAFSASAGESGDAMLQKFRHANNLSARANNGLFVHRSELLTAGLGAGDHIVFVDDFAGTGKQATEAWSFIKEVLPEDVDVHLCLVAASQRAIARIGAETELLVHADIVLTDGDSVFDPMCNRFSTTDKAAIKRYCDLVGPRAAREFAESGYVIVFAHSCPNNSLPVLHAVRPDWEGLFRRYD